MENLSNVEKLAIYLIFVGIIAVAFAVCWYFSTVLIYVILALVVSLISFFFVKDENLFSKIVAALVPDRIESNWKRDGNHFEWEITIPANTEAEVWIPTKKGYKVKTLGSGKYYFE